GHRPEEVSALPPVRGRTIGLLGSPDYWSPEQAQGRIEDVCPATDVYLLGATLYAIVNGKPPPPARKRQVGAIGDGRQVPDLGPQPERRVPEPLRAVWRKAMAYEPEGRYAMAEDLALDVERWLVGEPVSVYRDPLPVEARRLLNRVTQSLASGPQDVDLYRMVLELTCGQGGLDRERRAELARSYHQLGLLCSSAARPRDALQAYNRALELGGTILAETPDDLDARNESAKSLNNLALVHSSLDDRASACEAAASAVAEMCRLVAARPEATYRDGLLVGFLNLANAHRDDLAEAERAYEQAVETGKALVRDVDEPGGWLHLTAALQGRGKVRAIRGDLAAAEEDYREALRHLDRLVSDHPPWPDYLRHP